VYYKIVAKILSRRLKRVLSDILDECQSTFIERRHLLHSAVVAYEVVDEARRNKKKCLVFKVDYEKAYDSVCLNFLLYMMKRMCFCDKWVRWIVGCLKSFTISVLVNESPTTPPKRSQAGGSISPIPV